MKLIALAAAALGLALAAIPALAQTTDHRTMAIITSDIKLATPEGQKLLSPRIEGMVRSVCQIGHRDAGSRILTDEAKTCIAKARNSAQQQVAALMAAEERKGASRPAPPTFLAAQSAPRSSPTWMQHPGPVRPMSSARRATFFGEGR